MLTLLKALKKSPPPVVVAQPPDEALRLVQQLSGSASALGRDAAEVRGAIDDSARTVGAQASALRALDSELQIVLQAQEAIDAQAASGLDATRGASQAVQALGGEVRSIVETLQQVTAAAGQITQIALQTRLVAFNASVEAKRAGDAGRGFGVVADAVKDLAARVEESSKHIMSTVGALDQRISVLARETSTDEQQQQGMVRSALVKVERAMADITSATLRGREQVGRLDNGMQQVGAAMNGAAKTLNTALGSTETFLQLSEHLIETVASYGVETDDTPYIAAVQETAARIGRLLDETVSAGTISLKDLFDTDYRAVEGTAPQQHMTRFTALGERLFQPVQDALLTMSDKVVFCIAVRPQWLRAVPQPQVQPCPAAG